VNSEAISVLTLSFVIIRTNEREHSPRI